MSDKSLIVLAEEAAKIETALIESEGAITPELEAWLAQIDVSLPAKVENYSLLMDRMEALSDFYKSRADMLTKMARAANSVIERCEANLKIAMEKMQVDEIKGIDVRYKLQNSKPTVVIENEDLIPGEYTTIVPIKKHDKTRMAEDLKMGVPVSGARLEAGKHLRRFANTPGGK